MTNIEEMLMAMQQSMPEAGHSNEKEFTTRFGHELKERGGFFHKISDMSFGSKPFDAVFAFNGYAGGIEFKHTKHMSCNPFKMLRGSSAKNPGGQVKGLEGIADNGGAGLVIPYSYKLNRYKVFSIKDIDLSFRTDFDVQ